MSVYQIQFLTNVNPIYSEIQIPLIKPDTGILPDGSEVSVYFIGGNVPIYKVILIPNLPSVSVSGSITYCSGSCNIIIPIYFYPTNENRNIYVIYFTIPCLRIGNPVFVNIKIINE